MAITTLSSREFNQEVGRAKKSALEGPVFVTDRGVTTHVLLNVEEYRKITGKGASIVEMLSDPAMACVDPDFEFERIELDLKPAEFD